MRKIKQITGVVLFLLITNMMPIYAQQQGVDASLLSIEQRKNNPNPNPSSFEEIMKYRFQGKPMVGVGTTVPFESDADPLKETLTGLKNSQNAVQLTESKETPLPAPDFRKYINAKTPLGTFYKAPFVDHFPSFVSSIHVLANRGIVVEEEIQAVITEQNPDFIFTRTFEKEIRTPEGKSVFLVPHIMDVRLNGEKVSYLLKENETDRQLIIGNDKQKIHPGLHFYTLTYFIPNILTEQADNRSRLFWNVTGKDFHFPTEYAMVLVYFPQQARIRKQDGYLGENIGKKLVGYFDRVTDKTGNLSYLIKYPLPAKTEFIIDVEFDKESLPVLSIFGKTRRFLDENLSFVILCIGLIVLFFYYGVTFIVNKKQHPSLQKGGLSPMALAYAMDKKISGSLIVSGLISLAHKKALTIEKKGDELMLIKSKKGAEKLSESESKLMKLLFGKKSVYTCRLDDTMRKKIKHFTQNKMSLYLEKELAQRGLILKSGFFAFGIFLSLIILGMMSLSSLFAGKVFVSSLGIFLLTLGGFKWGEVGLFYIKNTNQKIRWSLLLILVLLPILAGIIGLSLFLSDYLLPTSIVLIFLLGIEISAAYGILRTSSSLKEEIPPMTDGYKIYLSQPPLPEGSKRPKNERTIFEKHLPYAVALQAADKWVYRFRHLTPSWYRGDNASVLIADLLNNFQFI